jgi:hypothetical protein
VYTPLAQPGVKSAGEGKRKSIVSLYLTGEAGPTLAVCDRPIASAIHFYDVLSAINYD